jgi:hypothetical protein
VEGEKYDFALAFPYSYSRCKAIEQKIAKRSDVVRVEPFAKSVVSSFLRLFESKPFVRKKCFFIKNYLFEQN